MRKKNKKPNIGKNMEIFIKKQKTINLLDEKGNFLGELSSQKAFQIAQEKSLDLILLSNINNKKNKKIIVKLGDRAKYLFEKNKKKTLQNKTTKREKEQEITMRAYISDHDLENIKIKKIKEILKKGNRVKIAISMRINRRMRKSGITQSIVLKQSKDLAKKIQDYNLGAIMQESSENITYQFIIKNNKTVYQHKYTTSSILLYTLKILNKSE